MVDSGPVHTTDSGAGIRPMRSLNNWALLGLVIECSGTGYAFHQRIEQEYEGLLSISKGHIYTALSQLERHGLVEQIEKAQRTDGKQRGQYRATGHGLRSYEKWIVEHMHDDRRQSQLWLRLIAVFAHHPDVGLRIVERMEQDYVDEARAVPIAAIDESSLGVVPVLVSRLTAQERRLMAGVRLPLVRYLRHEFEALEARRVGSSRADSP